MAYPRCSIVAARSGVIVGMHSKQPSDIGKSHTNTDIPVVMAKRMTNRAFQPGCFESVFMSSPLVTIDPVKFFCVTLPNQAFTVGSSSVQHLQFESLIDVGSFDLVLQNRGC